MGNETLLIISPNESVVKAVEKIFLTSCLSVIIFIALLGNAIVVVVFCTYQPLRKITNIFIVSLAVSDIIVGAVNIPSWIINHIWDFAHNELFWDARICMDIIAGVASILNLTAVSVYRFIQITNPYTHREIITRQKVTASLVAIWIFAGFLALLKGMIPKNNYSWYYQPGYQLLVVLVSFVIPMTGISYCYYRIFKEVPRHQNQQKFQSQQQKHWLTVDVKAIKTIAIVVMMFVICWCPFFTLVLVNGFCNCVTNEYLIYFVKILHYSNSAVNPIVYVWHNKTYRKAFVAALVKCAHRQGAEIVVAFLNTTDNRREHGDESEGKIVFLRS